MKRACKFTPLGFETIDFMHDETNIVCVNLPRWGLKLSHPRKNQRKKEV